MTRLAPVVRRATVVLLSSLALALPSYAATKAPGDVLVRFDRVPLGEVAKWYAETLGLNLIVPDPLSDRRITIVSARTVTPAEAAEALRSALATDGLRLVEDGAFLRVERDRPHAPESGPASPPSP